MMGISKRELLEEYYPDELPKLLGAWGALHGVERACEAEASGVKAFLDM